MCACLPQKKVILTGLIEFILRGYKAVRIIFDPAKWGQSFKRIKFGIGSD